MSHTQTRHGVYGLVLVFFWLWLQGRCKTSFEYADNGWWRRKEHREFPESATYGLEFGGGILMFSPTHDPVRALKVVQVLC